MKWFFALSERSWDHHDHDFRALVRSAVQSAARNTRLKPHLIFDGDEGPFTQEMRDMGVTVIRHRLSFYDRLEAAQRAQRPDWHPYMFVASGAMLRLDIPILETEEDFVLYTDCDVLFLQDPALDTLRPEIFAVAPERQQASHADMNSGVMVMNLPRLRQDLPRLIDFICTHFATINGFDQEAYRVFYKGAWSGLPLQYNWKPYWGINPDAKILHFHGPKPAAVRKLVADPAYPAPDVWRQLFNSDADAYRHYLGLWDEFQNGAGPKMSERSRGMPPAGFFAFVTTFHQSVLAADSSGAMLHTTQPIPGSPLLPVYAYARSLDATCWFLIAEPEHVETLRLHPQIAVGPTVPLRATRMDRSGAISFFSPHGGAFLCAGEVDPATATGALALAATLPRGYERFQLTPLHASRVPDSVCRLASALDRLGSPEGSAQRIVDFLRQSGEGGDARAALDAIGLLLSPGDAERVVALLTEQAAEMIPLLQRVFARDIYGADALPAAIEWLRSAPQRADDPGPATRPVRHIGEDYDRLDSEGVDGYPLSLPYALNLQARRMVKPRKRACIVTSARDEGIYLLEWIAFHRIVGFDHLFVYSNDNSDGSDELLRALHEAGVVTWVQSSVGVGRRAQFKAFGHALRVMPDTLDYEWSLLIDLDEFFSPNPIFGTVDRFLAWHECRTVDAIGINWLMVGSNGETLWRDAPLIQRFPAAIMGANQHIKTLFRTRNFIHSYAHDPATFQDVSASFRNASGKPHQYDPARSRGIALNPDIAAASIVHFFFKSNEEHIWKASRNRGAHLRSEGRNFPDWTVDVLQTHVAASQLNQCETGLAHRAEPLRREMSRLLEYPAVRQASDHVKAVYQERIGMLIRAAQDHPVIAAAGDLGRSFMAPLLAKLEARSGHI